MCSTDVLNTYLLYFLKYCTMCHSHDPNQPEKYKYTGPASDASESKLCIYCHEEVLDQGEEPGVGVDVVEDLALVDEVAQA